ncbi:YesL family protein [Mariluticola halotolerans]|uniref:YesL family protein n=1 Tax=Mariluticola halotolerans TaxID=2909283 RepID=UPI0026E17AC9|nr:YesL family protein [Mariluticola halotolerans]UJQ94238.1 YesL family protein [Mariluticola halotolerans]
MNWLYNFYFREGPGIPKDAPRPTGWRLLATTFGREWWELLKLNLLFVAVALPLVTLPAAYFAMTAVTVSMLEDRNVYLWRDFWTASRTRWRQSSLMGFGLIGAMMLAGFAVRAYALAAQGNLLFTGPLAIAVCALVLLPLFGMHVFTAMALVPKTPLGAVMKAAAIGLLARPLPGLMMCVPISLLWLAHILFYPASAFLPVLINFSLGALLTGFAVLKGVRFGLSHSQIRASDPPGEPDVLSA